MIKILMGGMVAGVGMIGMIEKGEENVFSELFGVSIFSFVKLLYKVWSKPQQLNYLGPSFSNTLGPCSCHSCFVIHIFSLSAICAAVNTMILLPNERRRLTIFASTAPPRKTICLRRGGSSILILNFCNEEVRLWRTK